MTSAREEILSRIRQCRATRDVTVPRDYFAPGSVHIGNVVGLLAERIDDYRATVHTSTLAQASAQIGSILTATGRARIVVPPGFPDELLADAAIDRIDDDPPLTAEELDATDGVITTCACAIALTGTVILDHRSGQGRRAVTLVPDFHLVVVRATQIVASVPDAIASLDASLPQTWISGPSATSDIELQRVEGVHGPRHLEVLIVTDS